jgi:predicted DNA-binding transcriptional regulator AlpA
MTPLVAIPTLEELAQHPARAVELPLQVLAALAGKCAALQSVIAAAQVSALVANGSAPMPADTGGDRLLEVDQAALKTGLTRTALYRRRDLPFKVRIGPKQVRFSADGIERWIRAKTAKPAIL